MWFSDVNQTPALVGCHIPPIYVGFSWLTYIVTYILCVFHRSDVTERAWLCYTCDIRSNLPSLFTLSVYISVYLDEMFCPWNLSFMVFSVFNIHAFSPFKMEAQSNSNNSLELCQMSCSRMCQVHPHIQYTMFTDYFLIPLYKSLITYTIFTIIDPLFNRI